MGMKILLLCCSLMVSILFPVNSYASQKITLLYNDRPPYQVTLPNDNVTGLIADPIEKAFRLAKIDFQWKNIPTNRQLFMIKSNTEMVCGVGWFKKPERELFALFSKPIYQDQATVAIANIDLKVTPQILFSDLMANNKIRILVKENYSYGQYADAILSQSKKNVFITTAENLIMLNMIKLGRADLMLTSSEEASYFFEKGGNNLKDFNLLHFPDMPLGEKRHLMCSKNIPPELLAKLNQHIKNIPLK